MPNNENNNNNNQNNNNNNQNNNNNNIELPSFNNSNLDLPKAASEEPQSKPIIEIPQEYYDKLAAEKAEKEKEALAQEQAKANAAEVKSFFGKTILLIIINAAAIFFLIRSYLTYNEKLIFLIPVYIIVMAVIQALISKKESLQPLSIMIGGMGVAVISFLLSAVDSKEVDMWSYYAIASAIVAFVGLILTSMITRVIADFKNVKALQSVGMIIFVIALVGVPYYLYQRNPEAAYRLIFQKKAEVKAETEDEYIIKTLNNRYNSKFVCDEESIKNYIDQKNRRYNTRSCYSEDTLTSLSIKEQDIHNRMNDLKDYVITVTSITYNQSENQYIVQDDYMDVILLKNFENKVTDSIAQKLSAKKVILYLYPSENCSFIGACPPIDDYFKNKSKEEDPKNQFNNSSKLDLSKYTTMTDTDFVNEYKFKYVFTITSANFVTEDTYQPAIDQVLAELDRLGLKNTSGYVIDLYNTSLDNQFPLKVYEKVGETNSKQSFVES